MNKFETIEDKIILFKSRFGPSRIANMLNIEPKTTLDKLLDLDKSNKEARELLIDIENDLEKYLLHIIDQIDFKLIKKNSLKRYNNNLKTIKTRYLNSQVDEQIDELKLKIVNQRNKHPLFIEIFSMAKDCGISYSEDPNKFYSFIAKKSSEHYLKKSLSPTINILKIASYLLDLADFISNNSIFDNLSRSKLELREFKDLFKSDDLYDKAIAILSEKGFIKQNNGELYWIFTPTKKYSTNQTLIALCVVLEIKHYLKNSTRAVYKNINNTFNIQISPSQYSRSSNGFKEDYDTPTSKNFSYTSLFTDIL